MKGQFLDLNQEQIEAVRYTSGPSIILAGAGSGKTRVLTQKALYLITKKMFYPENILMVTFTNKAANEMKERIKYRLGFCGTFHSLCAKILRVEAKKIDLDKNFVIYDEDDQKNLVKEIVKKMNFDKNYSPGYFLAKISAAKNELIDENRYREIFSDFISKKVADIYLQYQRSLAKNNALDFDDLIFKAIALFNTHPETLEKYQKQFRYILVDEFQDTNFAQYILIKILAKKHQNITVVGDFSQSIYSWRGAQIENLKKFQETFPKAKVFYLEQNYRSTQKILDFAYKIISQNQSHPILRLFTDNSSGEDVEVIQLDNEQYEGIYLAEKIKEFYQEGVDWKKIAVLYRMNAQSRIIEEIFLHFGIPYILIGGTRFYERREIKDILAYLRLMVNPRDEISLQRVIKIGKKKYGDFKKLYQQICEEINSIETIKIIDYVINRTDYLKQFNEEDEEDRGRLENIKELRSVAMSFPKIDEFLQQVTLVETEYSESEKKQKSGVYLMTLHQAKGLEFDCVFIIGVEEGILPHSQAFYDPFDLEEERRLFYVGITRARKKLFITYTKRRFLFGRRTESDVSRFLSDFEWR